MADVTMPVLNSTDESYVLLQWLLPEGTLVSAGDPLALVETSKTVTELVAEGSGYLTQALAAMSECVPTQVVAHLSTTGPAVPAGPAVSAGPAAPPGPAAVAGEADGAGAGSGVTVTRPARELMKAHGVPLAAVERLGKPIIRRGDVEPLIAAASNESTEPTAPTEPAQPTEPTEPTDEPGGVRLPAHQLAVARAVTRSHASIPAAFTVIKVAADSLLRRQEAISKQTFIGIPEFVINAIARTAPAFPACFASVGDDLRLSPAGPADIGVTIDVGTGLFAPVIRAADTLDLTTIARCMMRLRARAMRGSLSEHDLAGARITLALHQTPGIVLAQPIVYPEQTCALSLAAPDVELRLDADGQVTERAYFYLGLSYDHRVVNGREAAEFLAAISERLQAQ